MTDNPQPAPSQAALETLAAALDPRDFATTLTTTPGRPPRLTVTSRHAALGDDVYADQQAFCWSWAEPIAPLGDPRPPPQDQQCPGRHTPARPWLNPPPPALPPSGASSAGSAMNCATMCPRVAPSAQPPRRWPADPGHPAAGRRAA